MSENNRPKHEALFQVVSAVASNPGCSGATARRIACAALGIEYHRGRLCYLTYDSISNHFFRGSIMSTLDRGLIADDAADTREWNKPKALRVTPLGEAWLAEMRAARDL